MGSIKCQTVIDYFERSACLYDKRIAVKDRHCEITYGEFNILTNKLSHYLLKLGVTRNSVVIVIMDRSIIMLASIFAVLKVGGCYLPISNDTPKKRMMTLICDSCPDLILADRDISGLRLHDVAFVNINNIDINTEQISNPNVNFSIEDAAYIMYTSGSTGAPKGVIINHESLINRLLWMTEQYSLEPNDVIYHKTIYTFDVSVWELLVWSLFGGSVFLLEPGKEYDVRQIYMDIVDYDISVVHMVPSVLNLFLEYIDVKKHDDFKKLRLVISSGEVLTAAVVKRFYRLIQNDKVHLENLYGPTEATIDVTFFSCERDVEYKDIPIGKPIDGVEIILGENDKGIKNELMVSGICLGRGYLNMVELTYERFQVVSSKKIYLTGDICSYDLEHNLIYHGRHDSQIKIHGIRIELGEIDNCLSRHPDVRNCLSIVKKNNWNEKYICAYLILHDKTKLIDVKHYASEMLPQYMVPSTYKIIDAFPLTVNGKIDKSLLMKY